MISLLELFNKPLILKKPFIRSVKERRAARTAWNKGKDKDKKDD